MTVILKNVFFISTDLRKASVFRPFNQPTDDRINDNRVELEAILSAWNRFPVSQVKLKGSLGFLELKTLFIKFNSIISSLVAAAESGLQKINHLTAEIMKNASPEQLKFCHVNS